MEQQKVVKHSIGNTNGHAISRTVLLEQTGSYWLAEVVLGVGVGKLYQVGYLEQDNTFVPRKTFAMHEGLEAIHYLHQLGDEGSSMEPCKHEHAEWISDPDGFDDDSMLWCPECDRAVSFHCDACHGEGTVDSADYHCDWINYTPYEWETCPVCGGSGVIDGD